MTDQLIVDVQGPVGGISLNRPKALHALTVEMCDGILAALEDWCGDDGIRAVILDHAAGSRGFCAGGDIRMLAASGADDGAAARRFFATEYRMNHRLFTYANPIVAVIDGIAMGGGVGVSLPCRYRVATENTKFALDETGIGLFPDVGAGWYLSRLPGRIGQYLALTGHRLNGADCVDLGATHYLRSDRIDDARRWIVERPAEIPAILDGMAEVPDDGSILTMKADIDRLFAADMLEDILAALEADALDAEGGDWAARTLATLRTKSPQGVKVSLRLLKDGAGMASFADEMAHEYAVATRVVQRHDFAEGVRAVIVDKDNAPRWNPATTDGVSDHVIDQIFAPLPPAEAWTPQ